MSLDNKVNWSEGMFLGPQHFQQSDRYVEKLVRGRTALLRPFGWGLTHLRLNRELLSLGKLAIEEARGVLEDGTP
jgi:type VI secretion system protein ImpJ